MGGKKKYIEMFGSFMEPFNYHSSLFLFVKVINCTGKFLEQIMTK